MGLGVDPPESDSTPVQYQNHVFEVFFVGMNHSIIIYCPHSSSFVQSEALLKIY